MNYLEQCVEAIQSIDVAELEALCVGEAAGHGSSFSAYPIGRLSVARAATHVGLKIPENHPGTIENRMITDVTLITYLTNQVPELRLLVPRFMGVLTVERGTGDAVITEDASAGGQYKSDLESPLPKHIETALFDAFSWAGPPDEVFDLGVVRDQMPFIVNGQPRLLDFRPSPFRSTIRKSSDYLDLHATVHDMIGGLTITVSSDSELTRSLPTY